MGDVKRYTMDENSLMGGMDMFEDDDGDYVLHSDYATILTSHNALAIEHAALLINNNALVEAAKPVAAWWRKERMVAEPPYQIEHLVLGTDGPECVGVDELDALAALVGEEGE